MEIVMKSPTSFRIGYDIDGVLTPDVDFDTLSGVNELYRIRDSVFPFFKPVKDSYLITARPIDDRENTVQWIERFFGDLNLTLCMGGNHIKTPAESAHFKVRCCLDNKIDLFIESSHEIAAEMKALTKDINVVTIDELINGAIFHAKDTILQSND